MAAVIGIFGSATDPQCGQLATALTARAARVLLAESQALNRGERCAFDGRAFWYAGQRLDEADCWFVRHAMAPLPPTFERDGDYHLFADWYVAYLQRRERYGFQLSFLLELVRRQVPVVNPPTHAQLVQLKPLQLAAAQSAGLIIPRTLVTDDPWRARAFIDEVGAAVYKPSMGGGPCCRVDRAALARLAEIASAPVTLQEEVRGTPVRVIVIGQRVVAAVAIPTTAIDYRRSRRYRAGKQPYLPFALPDPVGTRCGELMRSCGLLFSAIDLIARDDGQLVFLEANSSPIYLDIERATGLPITDALADFLLQLAGAASAATGTARPAARPASFAAYALPFDPDRLVGGAGAVASQKKRQPKAGPRTRSTRRK